jgi:hypothetical protein
VKWNKPDGGVQHTADGRYSIVRAVETGPIWIAYRMGPTTAPQIGTTNSDELARQLCEDHERLLLSARKRA